MTEIKKKFYDVRKITNEVNAKILRESLEDPELINDTRNFIGIIDAYNDLLETITTNMDFLVESVNQLYSKNRMLQREIDSLREEEFVVVRKNFTSYNDK